MQAAPSSGDDISHTPSIEADPYEMSLNDLVQHRWAWVPGEQKNERAVEHGVKNNISVLDLQPTTPALWEAIPECDPFSEPSLDALTNREAKIMMHQQQTPMKLDGSLQQNVLASFFTLLISSGTLVCCVLPAVMVSLGAGAALAGLVTAVPQLIWMSEHKGLVFGSAALALAFSGVLLWRGRSAPCPADPVLGRACMRLRAWSNWLWIGAVGVTALGATFAFVLPRFL